MIEDTNESPQDMPSELDLLKSNADLMGVKYHPNIGLDKLKEKIADKQNAPVEADLTTADITELSDKVSNSPAERIETANDVRARIRKKAHQLVRVRVSCMNPLKGNLKGEILSVGNSYIGFTKKFIPFNAEQGWHLPQILLTCLQDKKYMTHFEVKIGNKKIKKHKLVPEYAIEILPPLTAQELKDLSQRQIIANK